MLRLTGFLSTLSALIWVASCASTPNRSPAQQAAPSWPLPIPGVRCALGDAQVFDYAAVLPKNASRPSLDEALNRIQKFDPALGLWLMQRASRLLENAITAELPQTTGTSFALTCPNGVTPKERLTLAQVERAAPGPSQLVFNSSNRYDPLAQNLTLTTIALQAALLDGFADLLAEASAVERLAYEWTVALGEPSGAFLQNTLSWDQIRPSTYEKIFENYLSVHEAAFENPDLWQAFSRPLPSELRKRFQEPSHPLWRKFSANRLKRLLIDPVLRNQQAFSPEAWFSPEHRQMVASGLPGLSKLLQDWWIDQMTRELDPSWIQRSLETYPEVPVKEWIARKQVFDAEHGYKAPPKRIFCGVTTTSFFGKQVVSDSQLFALDLIPLEKQIDSRSFKASARSAQHKKRRWLQKKQRIEWNLSFEFRFHPTEAGSSFVWTDAKFSLEGKLYRGKRVEPLISGTNLYLHPSDAFFFADLEAQPAAHTEISKTSNGRAGSIVNMLCGINEAQIRQSLTLPNAP